MNLRSYIIIPSYNQGQYIEETLKSVLNQNYEGVRIIVIDGGSTDNSIDVIEKYESDIYYWISEPDRGQTHAINKGLEQVKEGVWSYLNSDDLLAPESLEKLAIAFKDPEVQWVGGISTIFDGSEEKGIIDPKLPYSDKDIISPWSRHHKYVFPCSNVSFMRKEVIDQIGAFDESLDYSMDIEYYTRAYFAGINPYYIDDVLGYWRWHKESKTMNRGLAYGFRQDEILIAKKYQKKLSNNDQKILKKEIEKEDLWLPLRKLGYENNRNLSINTLLRLLIKNWKYMIFRPWWGHLRRTVFNMYR